MTEGAAAGTTGGAARGRTGSTLAWRLAPVAVALGSLALGLLGAGNRSLSTGEAVALGQAEGSFGSVLSRLGHDDPAQTGGVLLVKLGAAFGHDERSLRVPSAIAVALAVGLIVVLGTMLLGRVAGVVTGVALALNAGVVEASREMRPYAGGILGVVLATLLFAWALERGGTSRWTFYAIAAAALPLAHPLAASVLAAHGATMIVLRDRPDLRRAGVALLAGTVAAGVLLAWMAADRLGDPDGAGTLDLEQLGRGLGRAAGWNPILVIGAIAGLVVLFRAGDAARGRWIGALVTGLIAAPVIATLLGSVVLPVYGGALVLAAPGLALAVGAVAPDLARTRGLVWAGVALLAASGAVAIGVRLSAPAAEDWRALAAAVERVRGDRETVVVVPERSRAALAYYAPTLHVVRFARGEGAWIAVVADTPSDAIAAARPVVRTPRYALFRQFRYGDGLRLQHWIRP